MRCEFILVSLFFVFASMFIFVSVLCFVVLLTNRTPLTLSHSLIHSLTYPLTHSPTLTGTYEDSNGQLITVQPSKRADIEKENNLCRTRLNNIINQSPKTVNKWIVILDGTVLFFTKSRYIHFLSGIIQFILTIALICVPAYITNDSDNSKRDEYVSKINC